MRCDQQSVKRGTYQTLTSISFMCRIGIFYPRFALHNFWFSYSCFLSKCRTTQRRWLGPEREKPLARSMRRRKSQVSFRDCPFAASMALVVLAFVWYVGAYYSQGLNRFIYSNLVGTKFGMRAANVPALRYWLLMPGTRMWVTRPPAVVALLY